MNLTQVAPGVYDVPRTGAMAVPGRIFCSESLLDGVDADAVRQVRNVATLPGIVGASMAMPDIHRGYGFPIGGVAATDVEAGGVVSPGGVGFDICCGVRLLKSNLAMEDFAAHREAIMRQLDRRIPRGAGHGGIAPPDLLPEILARGVPAALEAGYGEVADLERCEERGSSEGADPSAVSGKAHQRGAAQIGSLGSGNHFLEIQRVAEVFDVEAASAFGLALGGVCVMIHCGSRGLGHQVCTDEVRAMGSAMQRHGITVPDRQLACVPVQSTEGERYLGAMAAAANFGWANRHILAAETRRAFAAALGGSPAALGMDLVFDVAHNLAKLESHLVDGRLRRLCVHRKGATRAFPPGAPTLDAVLRPHGQPVLVPGSMGTASWVLRGVEGNPAFSSSAHGAGRVMSRSAAKRVRPGREVRADLEERGVAVRAGSVKLLSEEASYAYKDVDEVVRACDVAGLAAPVARLVPVGVVKG